MKFRSHKTNQDSENLLDLEPYQSFLNLCKSPHTQSNYHQDLRVLKDFLDQLKIQPQAAQPRDLARFVGQLTKPGQTPSGKPRGAYSTRSMKRILASTRSFYRYLASIQQMSNDPTAVFYNLAIRSPQRNPHPLAPKDREAIVRSLKTSDWEDQKTSLIVLLGYHCGLRVSEMTHLKIRDIDQEQCQLTVIGKGDKERIVPMTEALMKLLAEYIRTRKVNSPYLFPSPRDSNKPIHLRYLELWVKKAASWAQLENPEQITVHVLRHTFGTQLAESGASVYEIRDLMGHASIMVSENYVKLASTKGRQAHQRAFGSATQVKALNLGGWFGVESVLKRHRSRMQKLLGEL